MSAASAAPPISLARRRAITAGLLLGMSLGALEATVIGTAMPTVIAALGGLAHYSWVFSAYLLTSTASVPIWGRLSDLYGRRRMYLLGVLAFLAGSAACGAATTMMQLIAARAVQGLGAGAIIPISQAVIGELYSLAERPRMQAVFSGMWGVASITGPLIGGYITDALSWRWVFYINLPFGLLALAVIALAYPATRGLKPVRVDWLGALLLFGGISLMLIGLGGEAGSRVGWITASLAVLIALVLVERRTPEPILPIDLLRTPVISRTFAVVFLSGFALFGGIAFIPLFVQAVQSGSATEAGQVLTPLFLGWVATSVVGARATVRIGYRIVAMIGGVLMTIGFGGLAALHADSGRVLLYGACFFAGCGMGCIMMSLLLAVQHGVERSQLGLATSLNQFSRSIGAAVGVAAMGALLAHGVGASVAPTLGQHGAQALTLSPELRGQFAAALHNVFVLGAIISAGCLAGTFILPAVRFGEGLRASAGEEMIEAEMTTLDRDDEPVVVPE
jgi:EmrB/QacA subfamily drug resistance transporter